MRRNGFIIKLIIRIFSIVFSLILLVCFFNIASFAAGGKTEVAGKVYEFDGDSHYEISKAKSSTSSAKAETYGTFSVGGQISNVLEKGGVPAYQVEKGNIKLFYTYGRALLDAEKDSWHLIDDESNEIDGMSLDNDILKGAIVLQTSKDRKNWIDVTRVTNVFDNVPIGIDSFYTATDIQLINGCFYRAFIVYETRVRTEDSNFLFINTDKYNYKKHAEVYEFYAYVKSETKEEVDFNQTYNIGSKVRVKDSDGYYGEETIGKNDLHYDMDIGNFFISGYTDKVTDSEGNTVFLKNVGDKATLWFNLKEDIDAIKGNSNIKVTADTNGFDQYFQTVPTNLGRGALIIRYTDWNNNFSKPEIYTNYLEANATVGADTKVRLFEEGDYEVALIYQITQDKLIDSVGHYRIFFKFSVRNGNCMVYPFDVQNGNELTNSSMTENGFRLDLAKSRYLKVNLKREVMKDSADGLVEDTRFNGPAKDGAEYIQEGIYTITVSNQYTNQFTVKKIYVGTDNILKAHITSGLSILEIKNLVADGAAINNDGTITLASDAIATNGNSGYESSNGNEKTSDAEQSELVKYAVLTAAIVVVCVIVGALVISRKKRKAKETELNQKEHDEQNKGGIEQ